MELEEDISMQEGKIAIWIAGKLPQIADDQVCGGGGGY